MRNKHQPLFLGVEKINQKTYKLPIQQQKNMFSVKSRSQVFQLDFIIMTLAMLTWSFAMTFRWSWTSASYPDERMM